MTELLEGICARRGRSAATGPSRSPRTTWPPCSSRATRAPSGSNRQPFRFVVLRDGPVAREAKDVMAEGFQRIWSAKRAADGYDAGSGADASSPKARMARTMERFVERFADTPVVVLACLRRYRDPDPVEGASVYPACQNLLLAARALGYGGVMTTWHRAVEDRAAAAARHPRRRAHGRDHPARAARGAPRPGPPPPARASSSTRTAGRARPRGRWTRTGTRFTSAGPPRTG